VCVPECHSTVRAEGKVVIAKGLSSTNQQISVRIDKLEEV